ncbi:unnamed protein product [Urochloa humidicola]
MPPFGLLRAPPITMAGAKPGPAWQHCATSARHGTIILFRGSQRSEATAPRVFRSSSDLFGGGMQPRCAVLDCKAEATPMDTPLCRRA